MNLLYLLRELHIGLSYHKTNKIMIVYVYGNDENVFAIRFSQSKHSLSIKKETDLSHTYTISLSHSAQIFCPVGRPLVAGGAGRSTGAITCFVTDGPTT